jgi:YVTN family beta-propeller protein
MGRYDRTSMALHWLIGLTVLAQITLGVWMLELPKAPAGLRAGWFNVHKSAGLAIAGLVAFRLLWRLRHRPPPLPAALPRLQRGAAAATQAGLYAGLLALPLTGYLGSSFSGYPIRAFGLTLPSAGWDWPAGKALMSALHAGAAWLLAALLFLHVGAALWHLARRDGLFARMWPACALLFVMLPALAAPLAYVANEKSGTLSIIDTASDRVTGEIATGGKPRGMALSRDGKWLYVSDSAGNRLLVVDTARRTVQAAVPLGESPEGIDLSPDGKLVAAASELANAVILLDTQTGKALATVKTSGKNPEHAVFSPDGRWIYASAEDASQVDVIDVTARRQVNSIPVARRPRGIAFSPDGKRVWVACELDSTVFVIDVERQRVAASLAGGTFSNGVTMHPDGTRVYVSNGRDGSVSVIDTQAQRIIDTVKVGQRPWNMAITADGGKLYVANGRSSSVSVIDTRTNGHLADIPVGEAPWGVVIRRD